MDLYQIITNKFVAGVEVEKGKIINTAPILRKFKGQSIEALKGWINKINGTVQKLDNKQ